MKFILCLTAVIALVLFAAPPDSHAQAPGSVDLAFNPDVTGSRVDSLAVQPDGKILIGGPLSAIDNVPRAGLARLNADGSLDATFVPELTGSVLCVAVQADGKILVGGDNGLVRLNADGSPDAGFNPAPNDFVSALVIQPDGKIVIGGRFTSVGNITRFRLARLNTDGTVDPDFNPDAGGNSFIRTLALQADGKILVGGRFFSIGGVGRNFLARINASGTLDSGFDPQVNDQVQSVNVQADGKVLVSGAFTTVNGKTRVGLARLNANGTLDLRFDLGLAFGSINSLVLQADDKILIGGNFAPPNSPGAGRIARLTSAGNFDPGFRTEVDGLVSGVALQADGRVLIGGDFLVVNGTARTRLARLNNEAATQTLNAPTEERLLWTRGAAAPELSSVTFEQSFNNGATWLLLGNATRVAQSPDWQLTDLDLSPSLIRARGRTAGGAQNASSGLIEQIAKVPSPATGGAVPGEPSGTTFRSFGIPSIDDSGSLSFLTTLQTASGPLSAIFSGAGILVREGELSVDAAGAPIAGRRFSDFKDPALNAAGLVAFNAILKGPGISAANNSAIFSNLGGLLQRVVGNGDAAPGFSNLARITSVREFSITSQAIFFTGVVRNGRLNIDALWAWTPANGSQLLLQQGALLDGSVVTQFSTLQPDATAPGQGRSAQGDRLLVEARFQNGAESLVAIDTAGSVSNVATSNSLFKTFNGPILSRLGSYAFEALLTNRPPTLDEALFANTGAGIVRLFGEGDPIDPSTGLLVGSLSAPLLNADNAVADVSLLRGPGVNALNNRAILFKPFARPLTLVARLGAQASDVPAGARWNAFRSLALPENLGPLFVATLKTGAGGVTAANALGLWAVDNQGTPRLLVREGDRVNGKTLRTLTVLTRTQSAPDQTRAFNSQRQIVYRATFSDSTQALVTLDVP